MTEFSIRVGLLKLALKGTARTRRQPAVNWDGEAMTMSTVPPLKTSTAAMRPLRSWPGASVIPLP
ncbi:MAG: hypothetical protein IMF08_05635 [Proteobacteria bacterium]|nr:hypothetical protein [Pseudomonadota bacterium]